MTPNLGIFSVPAIENEPLKSYAPGSPERALLDVAVKEMRAAMPLTVPCVVNGEHVTTGRMGTQVVPTAHASVLCTFHQADAALMNDAIKGALKAKAGWEAMPFNDRAAVFLKAADLLAHKYRYKVMAATMLGQGKNPWQAEIDAACELIDFWRFNCLYAQELYSTQPPKNSPTIWNRSEYRALEGFVLAVSPFNFTAIGGNLVSAPVLMGNVCVWKPSPMAIYSNYLLMEIFKESGLPDGVIQFVPGPAAELVAEAFKSPDFAALHFTGSTHVFRKLWKDIALNIDNYKSYPRIVGETGGKNMHFVHKSADPINVVHQTIRSSFEYQGQKCSACSRLYAPSNLWPTIKAKLIEEVKKITVGPVEEFNHFMTSVINDVSFNRCKSYIEFAKASKDAEIIVGGVCDDSKGYFVHPTVIVTTDPNFKSIKEEIFGPVLTVFVYPEAEYEKYLEIAANTSPYALTGSIFARTREAIIIGSNALRNSAGNFYINDKCTGAVVGQQPFGGARGSGTNDKAGAASLLARFVSPRSIKEGFVGLDKWAYPSNA